MPCYTKVPTKLIFAVDVEASAKKLGFEVKKVGSNTFVLTKNYESITLTKNTGEETYTASGDIYLLPEIAKEYALTQVKKFAKKKGYTVTFDQKSGDYVLISTRN
jgi:hypothetical protein